MHKIKKLANNSPLLSCTHNPSSLNGKSKVLIVFEGTWGYRPIGFNSIFNLEAKQLQSTDFFVALEKSKKSFTPILDILSKLIIPEDMVILYFSQTHQTKAKKIIQKAVEQKMELHFLAYSWGCYTTQKIVNSLAKQEVAIKSVTSFDPIRKHPLYLGFISTLIGDSNYFQKKANVEYWLNIYQKTDRFSLPFTHLKGSKVKGADENINLSLIDPRAGHCCCLFEQLAKDLSWRF